MNHSVTKYVSQIARGISLGVIALFPLFMLPLTSNFFEVNKLFLLVVATSLLLILWGVQSLATHTVKVDLTPFSLPLLGYGLFHFISSFIATPASPVEALMGRGSLFLALGLFVQLTVTLVDNRRFIRHAIYALIGSGTILAIITIFQSLGFGLSNLLNHLFSTTFANTVAFTPAGSPVALLSFLAPVILIALFMAFTKTDSAEKISLFVLSALMSAGFVIALIYSFPGKDTAPIFLPFQAGYAIAIETLKTPKNALLGVGTGSFGIAYNQFRPANLNLTDAWNIRFNASSSEILQMLTTVGLVGFSFFVWLIVAMTKVAKLDLRSTQAKSIVVAAFGILLLLFLIPGTYPLLFMFYLSLLLWGLQLKLSSHDVVKTLEVEQKTNERVMPLHFISFYTPIALLFAVAAASLYFAGRAYAAEMVFKQALDAATANDGVKTYDFQRQAIMQNPYLPRYRRAYAATNLALANSLSTKKDLADQDKQQIAQLVQQSIREAKVAVSMEPANVTNWESLALIYRSLINAAQGADQWTVAALAQAIKTDSVNPSLRIDLGGVYYLLGKYDQAIRLFQQAAELKADYANAYYNLSHAYQQKKDVVTAFDYMRQALSLTKSDSADYTKAKGELEELSKQLPVNEATKAATVKQTAPAKTELQTPISASAPAAVNLPPTAGPDTNP